MPIDRFVKGLEAEVAALDEAGTSKGAEAVVVDVRRPEGEHGPRFFLEGEGEKAFIRMNSNSYLGMSLREEVVEAEEAAARKYGVGPGAVRFISGTWAPHVELERRLAAFHGREATMITSAAYAQVMGVVATLTTPETVIVSDELNHNCIINGMKLARPKEKKVFKHLDLAEMEAQIASSVGKAEHVLVITDGVFSMRGDYAPLDRMVEICRRYDEKFEKNVVLMVDDSHGVGAYGEGGRGTESLCGTEVDILVGTLGKAFGVNGGYVVGPQGLVRYLREKNPFYIYSNPITPSEAAATLAALDLLEGAGGKALLEHLAAMTKRFEDGLVKLGFETIPSPHPVVPLLVRDTERTTRLVRHLREHGVLATGLNYPVVPKGDQLIRFQVSADHTAADIDTVLGVLEKFEA